MTLDEIGKLIDRADQLLVDLYKLAAEIGDESPSARVRAKVSAENAAKVSENLEMKLHPSENKPQPTEQNT